MNVRQAIVYDAVGTLIHVTPSVAEIYAEVGRRFGSRLSADEVRHRFPQAFARHEQLDRAAGWRTDEARERQRWRDIVAEVLDDTADTNACFQMLWETFSQSDAWRCDADAATVIATMHERGVRQAVASNFDRRLRGLINALPALRGLAPIVISSEIGWRKPAPEFFAHVVDVLQLPADAILFVGDDRVNDYDAARRAGMRALLFDPHQKHRDVGVDRLQSLEDLPQRATGFIPVAPDGGPTPRG